MINETFHKVDKIDFFTPLVAIANEVPELGPETTLADIDKIRAMTEKGITHVEEAWVKILELQRLAPNQELRDYIENGIRQYLQTAIKSLQETQKALSSGNTEKMKQALDEMKKKLIKTEDTERQRAELISQLGIDASEK